MLSKKNRLKELEKYRTHFFLLGLAVALAGVTLVLNWRFYPDEAEALEPLPYRQMETDGERIPITKRELPAKVSAPVKAPEEISVVENYQEIEEELSLMTSETDEHEAITDKTYQVTDSVAYLAPVSLEEDEEEEPLPFAAVESVPIFPGCENLPGRSAQARCFEKKVLEYVAEKVHYSEHAREMRLTGRIFVQFVVEKDGEVREVEVLRGVDPLVDEPAKKAIESLPRMTPAKLRGVPVRMVFVVPVRLVLQD